MNQNVLAHLRQLKEAYLLYQLKKRKYTLLPYPTVSPLEELESKRNYITLPFPLKEDPKKIKQK